MQKKTLKKLSILGLVLMAASAVTAAILPDSKEEEQQRYTLSFCCSELEGDTTQSCAPTDEVWDDDAECVDPSDSEGLGISGSTSLPFDGSTGSTTLV